MKRTNAVTEQTILASFERVLKSAQKDTTRNSFSIARVTSGRAWATDSHVLIIMDSNLPDGAYHVGKIDKELRFVPVEHPEGYGPACNYSLILSTSWDKTGEYRDAGYLGVQSGNYVKADILALTPANQDPETMVFWDSTSTNKAAIGLKGQGWQALVMPYWGKACEDGLKGASCHPTESRVKATAGQLAPTTV